MDLVTEEILNGKRIGNFSAIPIYSLILRLN